MTALTGEVQEHDGDRWRTVHLGDTVRVNDRRRVHADGADPLGLSREQRAASDWAEQYRGILAYGSRLADQMFVDAMTGGPRFDPRDFIRVTGI